jgi:hypothetical protein
MQITIKRIEQEVETAAAAHNFQTNLLLRKDLFNIINIIMSGACKLYILITAFIATAAAFSFHPQPSSSYFFLLL